MVRRWRQNCIQINWETIRTQWEATCKVMRGVCRSLWSDLTVCYSMCPSVCLIQRNCEQLGGIHLMVFSNQRSYSETEGPVIRVFWTEINSLKWNHKLWHTNVCQWWPISNCLRADLKGNLEEELEGSYRISSVVPSNLMGMFWGKSWELWVLKTNSKTAPKSKVFQPVLNI